MCDFGLAATGKAGAGTPNYMAPELLQGGAYTDKVDVYAFGILFNELLTRKVPYCGIEASRISDLVLAGQRPDIPTTVPRPVASIIQACWDKQSMSRPSFAVLLDQLQALECI